MNDTVAWFRPLCWQDASSLNKSVKLTTDCSERDAVAMQLGAEGVSLLEADLTISNWFDGAEISGRLRAVVTRLCGITLEPLDETVNEFVSIRIVPSGSPHAPRIMQGEIDLDIEAEDPPDVVDKDIVDLGAYLVEHLSLSLSPFPRKPDAVFEPPTSAEVISPFAVLARMKFEKRET